MIAGIRKISKGEICYMGEEIASWKIKERFEKGISYISDDRHRDGLVLDMNVEENLILRQYDKKPFLKNGIFQKKLLKKMQKKQLRSITLKHQGIRRRDSCKIHVGWKSAESNTCQGNYGAFQINYRKSAYERIRYWCNTVCSSGLDGSKK